MGIQFIVIALLTLMNAFFASAEMAMVSVNKNRIKVKADEGINEAALLMKLIDEPSRFLATIQVGITLAGFFSSAFAATGLADDLAVFFVKVGLPYANEIAFVSITIALSFVMLLFGELFPKRLAMQKAEVIAMFSVKPIYALSVIARPFVKLLSLCTNGLIRLIGLKGSPADDKVSEEEIRSLVKIGQKIGVLNLIEKQMINSIFEFDDKLAREVMTPRLDMWMVDIENDIEAILNQLIQLTYSRVPVYRKDKDVIVGVIHTKSLLVALHKEGIHAINLESLIQPVLFVPEVLPIDKLFIKMQSGHHHMAMLVDEHGLVTGLVTLEDLIEEVMGDITDEFDVINPYFVRLENGVYKVRGPMPLFEFNEVFHEQIESEEADSIGGYMLGELEGLPPYDETKSITIGPWVLTVHSTKGRRIETILVSKKEFDEK